MLPAVERSPSWTELCRLPGHSWCHWYHQTVLGHWLMEVSLRLSLALPLNQQLWTVLGVLGQPCHPCPLLLTYDRAKWGLQMGRADPCATIIIMGFRQHLLHPKLPCEVWLSTIRLCWNLNHPAWAPHWSKYVTGKRKHRIPWSRHGKISLPWACVLTLLLLTPPQHARLVTVPGVNSTWQLPCRLMASQGTPGNPQAALLPLLTSVLWATLMATWQARDRWM